MNPKAKGRDPSPLSVDAALSGILALFANQQERTAGPEDPKVELVLARVGLTKDDIAKVTGKNPDTIRKAIERARKRGG